MKSYKSWTAFLMVSLCFGLSAQAEYLQAFYEGRVSSVVTRGESESLAVKYYETGHMPLRICENYRPFGEIFAVFITGPESNRITISKKLRVSCTNPYPGNYNSGTFFFSKADDLELWDKLFPPNATGGRWFALQVAFIQKIPGWPDQWDSRHGQNYRLIFR